MGGLELVGKKYGYSDFRFLGVHIQRAWFLQSIACQLRHDIDKSNRQRIRFLAISKNSSGLTPENACNWQIWQSTLTAFVSMETWAEQFQFAQSWAADAFGASISESGTQTTEVLVRTILAPLLFAGLQTAYNLSLPSSAGMRTD